MKISFKYKYIIILFVVFVVVVSSILAIFNYSRANYAKNIEATTKYNGSGSYISSDILYDVDLESYNSRNNYFLSYDGNSLSFNVYNYESDSQISNTDIVYRISCTVASGYTCKIDNTIDSISNITLPVSYTCTNSSMSAQDCDNDPNETVTYLKNSNSHSISVKSSGSGTSTGTVTAIIYLTVSKPYYRQLTASLSFTFDPNEQGFGVELIKDYGYKCAYRLTNYSDAYTYYKLTTNSNNSFVRNGYNMLYLTLQKYESVEDFGVYINDSSSTCDNAFTVTAIS